MILIEVKQPSDWHEMYNKTLNDEWQREELDLLLEVREEAKLKNEKHKALIARVVNRKIKAKNFPKGSLIR